LGSRLYLWTNLEIIYFKNKFRDKPRGKRWRILRILFSKIKNLEIDFFDWNIIINTDNRMEDVMEYLLEKRGTSFFTGKEIEKMKEMSLNELIDALYPAALTWKMKK